MASYNAMKERLLALPFATISDMDLGETLRSTTCEEVQKLRDMCDNLEGQKAEIVEKCAKLESENSELSFKYAKLERDLSLIHI